MAIPEYIIKAAREYAKENGGGRKVEDAFIAGYSASRSVKRKAEIPQECNKELFEQCWAAYNKKGAYGESLAEWCKLSADERMMVLPHVKAYCSTRDIVYQKDFQRYLKAKTFMERVVVRGGSVIYDPTAMTDKEEYRPTTDGIFQYWDEAKKRLIFSGDIKNLVDGYTDDDRPDEATAAWGMYTWKWSRVLKQWIKQ